MNKTTSRSGICFEFLKVCGCAFAALVLVAAHSVQGADGFANVNGTTTGGAGGATVTVSDPTAFKNALNSSSPTIIRVSGTITIGVFVIQNKANKTIVGVNSSSGWNGNIQFKGCNNFVIQKLNIS